MKYSKDDVIQYVQEEDVKFIRLTFCDVFGKQKNIAIMPDELPRAFEYGISFDASSISGFGDETRSDFLLHPDPETIMPFPWRPEHGRVVQMFSGIYHPDGTPFACDTRNLLKTAVADAKKAGLDGIQKKMKLQDEINSDLYKISDEDAKKKNLVALPKDLDSAIAAAKKSDFIKSILPEVTLKAFGL